MLDTKELIMAALGALKYERIDDRRKALVKRSLEAALHWLTTDWEPEEEQERA